MVHGRGFTRPVGQSPSPRTTNHKLPAGAIFRELVTAFLAGNPIHGFQNTALSTPRPGTRKIRGWESDILTPPGLQISPNLSSDSLPDSFLAHSLGPLPNQSNIDLLSSSQTCPVSRLVALPPPPPPAWTALPASHILQESAQCPLSLAGITGAVAYALKRKPSAAPHCCTAVRAASHSTGGSRVLTVHTDLVTCPV